MTFWPSLNWPRVFKSSTRSKRFKTFRFAVMVLAPLRLRCCDIRWSSVGDLRAGRLQRSALFSTPHLKAPSTKIQAPKKLQLAQFSVWNLMFLWSLVLGVWSFRRIIFDDARGI